MAEISDAPQVTPSALCNLLIDLARQVQEGRSGPEELRRLAQEKLLELPRIQEETMARVRGQGEEHLRIHAESIAALQEAFSDMEGALRETLRYAESRQEPHYEAAVRSLTHAGFASEAAHNAYQRSELSHGPTEMPLLNLLFRLKEAHFVEGSVPREDVHAGIRGSVQMARAAAEEVRRTDPPTEATEALARAYEHFADSLEAVDRAMDGGAAAVAEALDAAVGVGNEVRAAMEVCNARIAMEGPTRMVHANVVLKLAEAHRAGALPSETLARGLEVFRQSLHELAARMEAMASIPSDSDAVAHQMEATRKAMADHDQALELFERYLAGDPDRYGTARQALIDASEALADCQQAFEQIGEREGKIPCVRCGAPNEPSNRSCSRCGAQLVMPTGMGSPASTLSFHEDGGQAQVGGDLVMTENLARLFETVNAVAEGRIDLHAFEDVLAWFGGLVRENLLELPPAPELSREGLDAEEVQALESVEEQLAAAREEMETGALDLLGALERMGQYSAERDSRHLVEGVRMVRDASVKVQVAQGQIAGLVEAHGPAQ